MKFSKQLVAPLLGAALAFAAPQHPDPNADNTKVNQRDRNPDAVTADKQKMNKADEELTRKIRKAIVADKALSTYAKNVKIVTQDGVVTLKGPVHSETEKQTLVAKAAEIAGANKVTDEITIKQ